MTTNEKLLHQFYTAFQQKDYKIMQACYAENANFSDAVFTSLDAAHVRAMWEMFCVKSKELDIEYGNIAANDKRGSAEWIATYIFSATGKKVVNHITADFTFKKGKIVKHIDEFNFYKWATQAWEQQEYY